MPNLLISEWNAALLVVAEGIQARWIDLRATTRNNRLTITHVDGPNLAICGDVELERGHEGGLVPRVRGTASGGTGTTAQISEWVRTAQAFVQALTFAEVRVMGITVWVDEAPCDRCGASGNDTFRRQPCATCNGTGRRRAAEAD